MEKSTVEKFANELNLPIDLLLKQLESAGIKKTSGAEELLEADKSALLNYLQIEHGASNTNKNKITLTRKQNTQIRKTDSDGRARTIQVEVRKKRTIVKPEQRKEVKDDLVKEDISTVEKRAVADRNQKEIRIPLAQAKSLAYALGIVMVNTQGRLEKLIVDNKSTESDEVVTVTMDGGSDWK